jgi:hypothetical protein
LTREEYKKINWNKNHKIIDGIIYRQCSRCEQWLIENQDFYLLNKSKPERGYMGTCKKCTSEKSYKYILKNIDNYKKKKEKYYNKIKKEFIANQKEYYKLHKNEVMVYNEKYRKSEHGKAMFRSYGEHRRHEMWSKEWDDCKKYFNYRCACCGLPIEEHYIKKGDKMVWSDFHKDHVYCDGKNDLSNCIPLCNTCNTCKRRYTINEFYNKNNVNYTYERYHKIYLWLRYDYKKYILPKKQHKRQHLSSVLKSIEYNKYKNSIEKKDEYNMFKINDSVKIIGNGKWNGKTGKYISDFFGDWRVRDNETGDELFIPKYKYSLELL